jgi:hypothetical protein
VVLRFELRFWHYHLSHISSHFYFSYRSDRVSPFCLGLASDLNPPTSALLIARITGMHDCDQIFLLFFEIGSY